MDSLTAASSKQHKNCIRPLTASLCTMIIVFAVFQTSAQQGASVTFTIREKSGGAIVPANIRIMNERGEYLFPDSNYKWKSFFGKVFPEYPSTGNTSIKLHPGKYRYRVDRGPEYHMYIDSLVVKNRDLNIRVELSRLVDMKQLGWWSGDLHMHRKVKDLELLMKCRDLHLVPAITSWNEHYDSAIASGKLAKAGSIKFDNNRYYSVTGAEDERNGGALLVLNTKVPINFTMDRDPEYPLLVQSITKAKKENRDAWIDIDKPFWRDLPVLLATGEISSIGIAHNHMNIDGDFDNEAWGIARDRNKYPPALGNGYYTQDIYYHVLNSGFRIPPSAGSASGVLMNPVGYNRMYVLAGETMGYKKWFDSAAKGRVFVTNGPLLNCKANDKAPGEVFTSNAEVNIKIEVNTYSRDTIESVEVIKNGTVVYSTDKRRLSYTISFEKSGWFLVRAICQNKEGFRFASTAPYYVEIGDEKKRISRSSVEFFIAWMDKARKGIKASEQKHKNEIDESYEVAKKFWEDLLQAANAE